MLMLLFYVGDERYALDSKRVVEVLPLVTLKKLHHAPEYVAGLFNYRGLVVPVIDINQLVQGNNSRSYLSTRIIIVNYFGSSKDSDRTASKTLRLLGVMAERVTETLDKTDEQFVTSGIAVDNAPFLGEIISDAKGMIQHIRVDDLLPESQLIKLLPQVEINQ